MLSRSHEKELIQRPFLICRRADRFGDGSSAPRMVQVGEVLVERLTQIAYEHRVSVRWLRRVERDHSRSGRRIQADVCGRLPGLLQAECACRQLAWRSRSIRDYQPTRK